MTRVRPARLLVAGAGLIGSRHARAVLNHPASELACVVDPDAGRARAFGVPTFESLEQVDVPIDGAIVATPSALHAAHVIAALEQGWPTLVEKPIASDRDGAKRIIDASRTTGLPVLTGHQRRYHASVRRVRELIDDGTIGSPVAATVIWAVKKPDAYFDTSWRSGPDGSPVRLNMVHEIDLLRFLLGEVESVSAIGAQPIRKAGRVENGVIALRFVNGCVASVVFADTAPSPWSFEAGTGENPNIGTTGQDCLFISGTNGGVAFPSLTLWRGARDWGDAATPTSLPVGPTDAIAAQLDHFLDVIAGRASTLIDAEDASRTLDVVLRVEEALENSG